MKREIGSNFWFIPEDLVPKAQESLTPDIFGCNGTDIVWLSSCRSAISLVIEAIEKRNPKVRKIVCLPAFTCQTVYQPFINKGYSVIMLPVEKDLTISAEKAAKLISKSKPGIVLLHKFFGFDTLPESKPIIEVIKNIGALLIEDLTQSMYSNIERLPADYYVGSIRKWCGVVDGGFSVCKEGKFDEHPTETDADLESVSCEASNLKYQYMKGGNVEKTRFLTKFREAKVCIDNQGKKYSISPISQTIQSNLDIETLSKKRRGNFETLINGINGIESITPAFSSISSNEVPLYFPIICQDRAKIQSLLAENNIYAPIIWPKEENCPAINTEADFLYGNMLCIPLDQRYDTDDMERIVGVLRTIMER